MAGGKERCICGPVSLGRGSPGCVGPGSGSGGRCEEFSQATPPRPPAPVLLGPSHAHEGHGSLRGCPRGVGWEAAPWLRPRFPSSSIKRCRALRQGKRGMTSSRDGRDVTPRGEGCREGMSPVPRNGDGLGGEREKCKCGEDRFVPTICCPY